MKKGVEIKIEWEEIMEKWKKGEVERGKERKERKIKKVKWKLWIERRISGSGDKSRKKKIVLKDVNRMWCVVEKSINVLGK